MRWPDPYRIVIDFPELDWRIAREAKTGRGVVRGYRSEPFLLGTTRIVLDVSAPPRILGAFVLPSQDGRAARFVLDLKTVPLATFAQERTKVFGTYYGAPVLAKAPVTMSPIAKSAPALAPQVESPQIPVPLAKPRPAKAMPAATSRPSDLPVATPLGATPDPPRAKQRPMVVIDAGHGGQDPGALGIGGVREKDITLAMARRVATLLEQSGRYRVKLTRDSDVFLRLRHRVLKAREIAADLFISLHADAIDRDTVRGTSVYTLGDAASDKEAAMLAAEENRADALAGLDLSTEYEDIATILIDLAQRNAMNHSRRFATGLVAELGRDVTLLRQLHRSAGFAVLKAPDVPSVLIEMGYLSSPQEAKLLTQANHQRRLAMAIMRGIDAYFGVRASSKRP
jgi:N-acetylmuramoyl-L-alanine amidase